MKKISIIIPVLNEKKNILEQLSYLNSLSLIDHTEIIVVDGNKDGTTINMIKTPNIITRVSPKGRGVQLACGADCAKGDIYLFLHADTRLPKNSLIQIQKAALDSNFVGGAFSLGIAQSGFSYRLIEFMANLRTQIFRIPYGDQAIFLDSRIYEAIGGFQDIPIMEDVALMQRIKRNGLLIQIFRQKVATSSRRWEQQGVCYTTLRNWLLVSFYYMGVSPEKLMKFYPIHKT